MKANSARWHLESTTTYHRYCTAYVVSNGTSVTMAITYVRTDAVDCSLDRVENYSFEVEMLLADSGFYNERVVRSSGEIVATVLHVPKMPC
ncbi:hypothetical protein SAMN06264855_1037 [Halorubrum vacuolatum]|uniref:Transposase DDE domain-containing protein n=1 Tax=Halorubrum vacuolatum TaxID=63740 RepID=A0A238VK29_HALVU|nr:hypothetical protein SAMN06264855_1037 [Halorubrum vacuolatum]